MNFVTDERQKFLVWLVPPSSHKYWISQWISSVLSEQKKIPVKLDPLSFSPRKKLDISMNFINRVVVHFWQLSTSLICKAKCDKRPTKIWRRLSNRRSYKILAACHVKGTIWIAQQQDSSYIHFVSVQEQTDVSMKFCDGWFGSTHLIHVMDIVTLMPKLPLSAKSWAILVSNTKQSLFIMADCTPSWILRGVASQVRRRRWPFNSSLEKTEKFDEISIEE
jgi:hypothetical protein